MAESLQIQLDRVQTAIARIEEGNQSYAILGRNFTKADLRTLYERERALKAKITRQIHGGFLTKRVIPL